MLRTLSDSHIFRLIAFSDNKTGFFPLCRHPGEGRDKAFLRFQLPQNPAPAFAGVTEIYNGNITLI
jgi:FPC/CPF motif-containing protein YcgG